MAHWILPPCYSHNVHCSSARFILYPMLVGLNTLMLFFRSPWWSTMIFLWRILQIDMLMTSLTMRLTCIGLVEVGGLAAKVRFCTPFFYVFVSDLILFTKGHAEFLKIYAVTQNRCCNTVTILLILPPSSCFYFCVFLFLSPVVNCFCSVLFAVVKLTGKIWAF